ncbi:MAG: prolipoprotein diacylglyceryl transferase [Geminicoccaceae bacterium]
MLVLPFPAIDPVLVELGPIQIRWYSLAYIAGLLIGWRYLRWLVSRPGWRQTSDQIDDLLVYATLGVILGGRLGYVLFYQTGYYWENPGAIFAVWQGGMSFHGGVLGVVIACLIFGYRQNVSPFEVGDAIGVAAPIGLFFGRIANFINGELYGRASDVPWAMVFPTGGPEPRHPSQLYEAFLEGLVLFWIMAWAATRTRERTAPGFLSGLFLVGYGLFRFIVEFAREPDAHLGFIWEGFTMGQLLSLPMILIGVLFIALFRARRTPVEA